MAGLTCVPGRPPKPWNLSLTLSPCLGGHAARPVAGRCPPLVACADVAINFCNGQTCAGRWQGLPHAQLSASGPCLGDMRAGRWRDMRCSTSPLLPCIILLDDASLPLFEQAACC